MSRAFDVWDRSEYNSQCAVMPFQTYDLIHTHWQQICSLFYQGAVVFCVKLGCSVFPLKERSTWLDLFERLIQAGFKL